MASRFSLEREIGGGFLVDESMIRRIQSLMAEISGVPVKITAYFGKQRIVSGFSFEDIFNDSYLRLEGVSLVCLKASSDDFVCEVIFKITRGIPISITASGKRDSVIKLESEVLNEIFSAKMWYSPFVLSQYTVSIGVAFDFIFLAIGIFVLILMFFGQSAIAGGLPGEFWYLMALSFLINPILSLLFPPMVFNIGKGARDFDFRRSIYSFFFYSIVFALVMAILSNFLTDWLKSKM